MTTAETITALENIVRMGIGLTQDTALSSAIGHLRQKAKMEAALAFYADESTYEQVDILAKCGLSDDAEDIDGWNCYGKRARAALAPASEQEAGK